MKFRNAMAFSLLSLALAASTTAFASFVSTNEDLPSLLDRQREIAAQAKGGNKNLSDEQKRLISEEQKKIYSLVDGKRTLDELAPDQRVQLVNSIEKINAAIEGTQVAEEKRVICRRERSIGSNMPMTRCVSRGQRDAERNNARNSMEQGEACLTGACRSN